MRFRDLRLSAATVVLLFMALSLPAVAADGPADSQNVMLRPGLNETSLFEQFSRIIVAPALLNEVRDFDPEVIRVQEVQGYADRVQIFALKAGVTTVTMTDIEGGVYSLDVLVRGDVRHLESVLRRHYPNDSIRVEEIRDAVRLDGWVTQPEHIEQIIAIAQQFYPNVMNHMKIGGVQQVTLKCTVMEVQRSKIRTMGMNFSLIKPDQFLVSTPGPITPIETLTSGFGGSTVTLSGFQNASVSWGVTDPGKVFNGFLQALREEGYLEIVATPVVTTHNGRPASILSGGETPVLSPAGLGTTAVEFREFGVQLDAVPYILGNGRVRLELEPRVSDRDFANAVTVQGITIPAFTVRKANTEVTMKFGETLVIAGLITRSEEATAAKLPFFGELPWIGSAFNRKRYTESERELVILVTPEYAAPMQPDQVPAGGPGQFTTTPTDHELYWHHLLEVPKYGDDCESCFNCTQCRLNGSCPIHPNGCSRCGGTGGTGACTTPEGCLNPGAAGAGSGGYVRYSDQTDGVHPTIDTSVPEIPLNSAPAPVGDGKPAYGGLIGPSGN